MGSGAPPTSLFFFLSFSFSLNLPPGAPSQAPAPARAGASDDTIVNGTGDQIGHNARCGESGGCLAFFGAGFLAPWRAQAAVLIHPTTAHARRHDTITNGASDVVESGAFLRVWGVVSSKWNDHFSFSSMSSSFPFLQAPTTTSSRTALTTWCFRGSGAGLKVNYAWLLRPLVWVAVAHRPRVRARSHDTIVNSKGNTLQGESRRYVPSCRSVH